MAAILIDASALIALLDRGDRNQKACVIALESLTDPLMTVWPAVTEAMHLLAETPAAQEALSDMLTDDAVGLANLDDADLKRMKVLMQKYRDLPMDFADAALVRVAERERLSRILTFDKHFRVYALPGRARFVVIPQSKR